MSTFFTEKPLVVFGATGLLGSQVVFMACMDRFSPRIVLHGSHLERLTGLCSEVRDAGFQDIEVKVTTDVEEACHEGGYIFYSRSIQSGKKTREEMLLDNAPAAAETGLALRAVRDKISRVVCVSNPSDLIGLTLLVHSELAPHQLFSLSALDTMRYHRALQDLLGLQPDEVEGAYALGSHDMAMAVMRDTVKGRGVSLDALLSQYPDGEAVWDELRHRVVNGGRMIIKQRGHTAYQSPAYLGYRILRATDTHPFTLPTAMYHHSERFAHCFFSLPTLVDSGGGRHLPLYYSERDLAALAGSYASIASLRDILLQHQHLPPISLWPEPLHRPADHLVGTL